MRVCFFTSNQLYVFIDVPRVSSKLDFRYWQAYFFSFHSFLFALANMYIISDAALQNLDRSERHSSVATNDNRGYAVSDFNTGGGPVMAWEKEKGVGRDPHHPNKGRKSDESSYDGGVSDRRKSKSKKKAGGGMDMST